ncbi:VanW family protein [Actinoplanes sp. NPDC048796]|uniref:VanW family protein n=1 Tax=unclassified Actinoplanes TaxID=2626549 RepID=UPI0033FDC84B
MSMPTVPEDQRWTGSAVVPTRPPRRHWRWVLGVVAALVVIAVGLGVAFIRMSPAVADETYVAGIAVGGLDDAQLTSKLDGAVRQKIERPITVEVGDDERFAVNPAEAGIKLDVDATRDDVEMTRLRLPGSKSRHDVTPVITVDESAAKKALDAKVKPFNKQPRDASVKLAPPPTVIDGKGDLSYEASTKGVTLDKGEPGRGVDTSDAVKRLVKTVRDGGTTLKLSVTTLKPGNANPKLAGVDQLIGTFTTYHPCCAPRVTNIHRIAELIDNTVVPAGGTFSLNDAAGERTKANGFVAAPAIVDGELEDQLGGGVSQFSTTLFNAAWFAGLDIEKHQPHSLYISRYPPGREATLDWRSIDNVIKNDTDAPFVIRARTTGTSVTVGIYGHTGDREVSSVTGPRQPRGDKGGFRVSVTRTINQDGSVKGKNTISWTYQGLD